MYSESALTKTGPEMQLNEVSLNGVLVASKGSSSNVEEIQLESISKR